MKRSKIYTMTVVSGDPGSRDPKTRLRARCWGYYFNRKDAEEAIMQNATDMSECDYYHFAVLGELGEGPMPHQEELQWYEFQWNWYVAPRADGVRVPEFVETIKISKPSQYEQILFAGLS